MSTTSIYDIPTPSALGVAVARLLGLSTLILTGTKALQAAYGISPTSIPMVTGRPNHRCYLIPGIMANEGPCRIGFECPHRHGSCPYFQQRDRGLEADIVVANYAVALVDPEGSLFEGRDLIICDEAHLLESQLAEHLGIELSGDLARFEGFGLLDLPSSWSRESLMDWGASARGPLSDLMERCELQARVSGAPATMEPEVIGAPQEAHEVVAEVGENEEPSPSLRTPVKQARPHCCQVNAVVAPGYLLHPSGFLKKTSNGPDAPSSRPHRASQSHHRRRVNHYEFFGKPLLAVPLGSNDLSPRRPGPDGFVPLVFGQYEAHPDLQRRRRSNAGVRKDAARVHGAAGVPP